MRTHTLQTLFALNIAFWLLVTSVGANDALVKGDEIIDAVDRHEDGYQDLRSNVTMILENARGRKRERHLDIFTIELSPLGDRRKFIFNRPADIKGTAILVHSNVVKNDDHWIFLPAFKRVKRIASSNKSSPFVGSEYSYEDLSSQEKEKYSNRYVESKALNGKDCDIVERVPKYPHSAYSRLLVYVDKQSHRYQKVEYFNKAGKQIKTQYIEEYELYKDRYLLPNKTIMVNHVTDKKTTMVWRDIRLKTAQTKNQYSPSALAR